MVGTAGMGEGMALPHQLLLHPIHQLLHPLMELQVDTPHPLHHLHNRVTPPVLPLQPPSTLLHPLTVLHLLHPPLEHLHLLHKVHCSTPQGTLLHSTCSTRDTTLLYNTSILLFIYNCSYLCNIALNYNLIYIEDLYQASKMNIVMCNVCGGILR